LVRVLKDVGPSSSDSTFEADGQKGKRRCPFCRKPLQLYSDSVYVYEPTSTANSNIQSYHSTSHNLHYKSTHGPHRKNKSNGIFTNEK
jgi:hypothetical protein